MNSMKNLIVSGHKLYLRNHVWVRLIQSPHLNTNFLWRIDVGITDRGLDDIGDVTSIENFIGKSDSIDRSDRSSLNNQKLKTGDDVLKINWDAHFISAADELYHTSWESISDTTTLVSPLGGTHGEICLEDETMIDSDTTLFTMRTDNECIQRRKGDFLHFDAYQEFVGTSEHGKFYEFDHSS